MNKINAYNNKNNCNINESINDDKANKIFNMFNNTYIFQLSYKYNKTNKNDEKLELECICNNYNYKS